MIAFAVRRPAVVLAASMALLAGGTVAMLRLPLATRAAVELPRLQVHAFWFGASPEVVETYLTAPVEAAVQSVRGVARVESISADDRALLTVALQPGADIGMTRLAILERLELLRRDLPPGASLPAVSNYVPEGLEEAPLLSITASGPYTAGTLQRTLHEKVAPRLSSVPGVAGVAVRGGTSIGVAISYDALLLQRLGIPPMLLPDAVRGARVVQALGTQSHGPSIRNVVLRDQPGAIEELLELPVRAAGGRIFRLGALARVRTDEDARGGFYRVNGRPAVAIDVTRHPGGDAIRVARAVRAALAAAESSLPPGVALTVDRDESRALARDLRDLAVRGTLAVVAVLAVLALGLRRTRAVTLVLFATLVAVAATALTLFALGVAINLLVLAGLSMGFGVLVQNALVVVRCLGTESDTPHGRARASRRIAPAVVGSTLATGIVLLPFLYLQGTSRAAFVPFALALSVALAWSVVTALLVVPALGAGAAPARTAWRVSARLHAAVLARLLRWRAAVLVATACVLALMTWAFVARVPRSAFTSIGERGTSLSVSLSFPRGSDPAALDGAMRAFESLAVGRQGVEAVRAQAHTPGRAEMHVAFTREGARTVAPRALQEALVQRAVLTGGVTVHVVGEGPGFSAGGNSGGSLATFRLRVKGFSYAGVERVAGDLAARLERVPRVRETRITSGGVFAGERGAQVTLSPDRGALARYGVGMASLAAAVARETRGPIGRDLLEIGGDELPVMVKADGASDRSMEELSSASVPTGTGAPVRVADIATVSERDTPGAIVRDDQQYVRHLSYDYRGPGRLARRAHAAFMQSIEAPPGYAVTDVSHGAREDEDAEQGLFLVFVVGVTLVLLSVALVFDSAWGALLVMSSLPLCLAGVVAAFWATGAAFSREAAVGVILVVGLAVNHAILLIDAALVTRRRRLAQGGLPGLSAADVLRASRERSGAIVFVTLASLASLTPLSIGTDPASLSGAIALATAGGTVAGTLGALFVLPLLLVGRRESPPAGARFRGTRGPATISGSSGAMRDTLHALSPAPVVRSPRDPP